MEPGPAQQYPQQGGAVHSARRWDDGLTGRGEKGGAAMATGDRHPAEAVGPASGASGGAGAIWGPLQGRPQHHCHHVGAGPH